MKIACLAWGSLLWKTAPLPLASSWQPDGPRLPLEFTRAGDQGELSPTLCPGALPMSTWWAVLDVQNLDIARERLREREEISRDHPEWVGSAPGATGSPHAAHIGAWMGVRGLDAVVWTALPPRIDDEEGRQPTGEEAVAYLQALNGERRAHARDYLQRMPAVFDTPYRRLIQARLGWAPVAAMSATVSSANPVHTPSP